MVYFLCKAYDSDRQNCYFARSLPVQGAWIEMSNSACAIVWHSVSLPVQGAWIEIASSHSGEWRKSCRSPCRERGLKCLEAAAVALPPMSLPVQGAWIEMSTMFASQIAARASLPVQGAWIEIDTSRSIALCKHVAPRAGSVD